MTISAATQWWIRADGNNANGGGFDPSISGAVDTGLNDSATPALSVADIVTVGTTTVTSVTGGFTSAMIGYCLRIVGDNYYFITAVASTNSITVDRATGTATGQSGNVAGAFASLENLMVSGIGTGYSTPSISTPMVAGNTIFIRGSGVDDPITDDYTNGAGGFYSAPSGNSTTGPNKLIGYNGRPRISHSGLLLYSTNSWHLENLVFFLNASPSYPTYGIIYGATRSNVLNCKIDINGHSACHGLEMAGRVLDTVIMNSGAKSGTGSFGFYGGNYASTLIGCKIEDIPGAGVADGLGGAIILMDSVVVNCNSVGVYVTGYPQICSVVRGNTIDNNGGDGIVIATNEAACNSIVLNNVITNNGGYGINYSNDSAAANDIRSLRLNRDNIFDNNTSGPVSGISSGVDDQNIDPLYNDAGSGDYTPAEPTLQGAAYPPNL